MTREERNSIILEKFAAGVSVKDIAANFSVSESWVNHFLSKSGVRKRNKRDFNSYYDLWFSSGEPSKIKDVLSALKVDSKTFYRNFGSLENFKIMAYARTLKTERETIYSKYSDAILYLYSECELGYISIAKILNISVSSVRDIISKLHVKTRLGFEFKHGGRRRNKNSRFSIKTRKDAYVRENGRCQYCGEHVDFNQVSFHHFIPVYIGGDNSLQNCCVLHDFCHREHFEELHRIKNSKYCLSMKTDIDFYKNKLTEKGLI